MTLTNVLYLVFLFLSMALGLLLCFFFQAEDGIRGATVTGVQTCALPILLRLVQEMVADGAALCVAGNHERKLLRALRGKKARIGRVLAESLRQLGLQPPG